MQSALKQKPSAPQVIVKRPLERSFQLIPGGKVSLEDFKNQGQQLLKMLLMATVNHPEDIAIRIEDGPHTTVFHIGANRADWGQIIGKEGRNIMALRHLLHCLGVRCQYRAVIATLHELNP